MLCKYVCNFKVFKITEALKNSLEVKIDIILLSEKLKTKPVKLIDMTDTIYYK